MKVKVTDFIEMFTRIKNETPGGVDLNVNFFTFNDRGEMLKISDEGIQDYSESVKLSEDGTSNL